MTAGLESDCPVCGLCGDIGYVWGDEANGPCPAETCQPEEEVMTADELLAKVHAMTGGYGAVIKTSTLNRNPARYHVTVEWTAQCGNEFLGTRHADGPSLAVALEQALKVNADLDQDLHAALGRKLSTSTRPEVGSL